MSSKRLPDGPLAIVRAKTNLLENFSAAFLFGDSVRTVRVISGLFAAIIIFDY